MDKVIFSATCYPTMICLKFYKMKTAKKMYRDMKEKALPNFLQTLTSFIPFYFCQEVAVPSSMTAF